MIRKIALLAITTSWLIAGADIRGLVDYDKQDFQRAQKQENLELVPLAPVVPPTVRTPIVSQPVISQPQIVSQPVMPTLPVVVRRPFYMGMDLVNARFSAESGSDFNSLIGIVGKIGYDFNEYFGVEARFGTGLNNEDIKSEDATFEAELKETYGLYLKPQVPLNRYLNLFALIGYAQSKVDITNTTVSAKGTVDEGSVSYGVGLGYHVNDRVDIVFDALRLWHDVNFNIFNSEDGDTELTLDTLGLGFNYKF